MSNIPDNVIVDDEDRAFLESMGRWFIDGGYCLRNGPWDPATKSRGKKIRMHRAVIERAMGRPLKPGHIPDHIDRNPLNNSRSNLREIPQNQNAWNRPETNGVYWDRHAQKWKAQISVFNKRKNLGRFDDKAAAEAAYERAKAIYHVIP